MLVTATINGRQETFDALAQSTLMDVLRDSLFLRGTKEGCREGECGACTVLVDGRPLDSCIYAAHAVNGRTVETIEGLGDDLSIRIKSAMVDAGGVQCGYCTPGIVVMLAALLRQHPAPDEETIRRALAGNICRCTGYAQIIDAVQRVIVKTPKETA
jgi:aerobic-type carbon monoxide dehydrogenase small subunit (CoxS/CutS family)